MNNYTIELNDYIFENFSLYDAKVEVSANFENDNVIYTVKTSIIDNWYYLDQQWELLERANYQAMTKELKQWKMFECSIDSHLAYEIGMNDTIDFELLDAICSLEEDMQSYPLLDDGIHSQLEQEAIEEYCDNNYTIDMSRVNELTPELDIEEYYRRAVSDIHSYTGEIYFPYLREQSEVLEFIQWVLYCEQKYTQRITDLIAYTANTTTVVTMDIYENDEVKIIVNISDKTTVDSSDIITGKSKAMKTHNSTPVYRQWLDYTDRKYLPNINEV